MPTYEDKPVNVGDVSPDLPSLVPRKRRVLSLLAWILGPAILWVLWMMAQVIIDGRFWQFCGGMPVEMGGMGVTCTKLSGIEVLKEFWCSLILVSTGTTGRTIASIIFVVTCFAAVIRRFSLGKHMFPALSGAALLVMLLLSASVILALGGSVNTCVAD